MIVFERAEDLQMKKTSHMQKSIKIFVYIGLQSPTLDYSKEASFLEKKNILSKWTGEGHTNRYGKNNLPYICSG